MKASIDVYVRLRRTKPLFVLLRAMGELGLLAFIDPTPLADWWMRHVVVTETSIDGKRWRSI